MLERQDDGISARELRPKQGKLSKELLRAGREMLLEKCSYDVEILPEGPRTSQCQRKIRSHHNGNGANRGSVIWKRLEMIIISLERKCSENIDLDREKSSDLIKLQKCAYRNS
jgi:hypothetical protein